MPDKEKDKKHTAEYLRRIPKQPEVTTVFTIKETLSEQPQKKQKIFLPDSMVKLNQSILVANDLPVPEGTTVKVLHTSADPNHVLIEAKGVRAWVSGDILEI